MTGPSSGTGRAGAPPGAAAQDVPARADPVPGVPARNALPSAAARFLAMHHGPQPLVLPNVWDAVSARVFAEAGFPALATSSGAIAAALGYADGEQTPAAEMFAAVARIARSVDVPVTADIEAGYGLSPAELAGRLAEAGVVGCNLEDSDPASRALRDPRRQADFLAAVRAQAVDSLVLNARIDVFVRGPDRPVSAVEEAIGRARRYLAAGADCVYPILAPPEALPRLAAGISGPVNAMYRPGGLALAELAALGVARISFGSGLHAQATAALRSLAAGR